MVQISLKRHELCSRGGKVVHRFLRVVCAVSKWCVTNDVFQSA